MTPEPEAVPLVPNLAVFLTGLWRITRRIADRRSGATGRLVGTATFSPAMGSLHYKERGVLTWGGHRHEASQTYWFAAGRYPGAAEVRFADGRRFHALDMSTGLAEVEYDCMPDRYRGRYRVGSWNDWTLVWKIEGPRKCMFIGTAYARMVAMSP